MKETWKEYLQGEMETLGKSLAFWMARPDDDPTKAPALESIRDDIRDCRDAMGMGIKPITEE